MMPFCEICGNWFFNDENHKCPPLFIVEYEDSEKRFRGIDAEDAAVNFARYWDNGDYHLLNGFEMEVKVTSPENETKSFKVRGRLDPVYYAEEIT